MRPLFTSLPERLTPAGWQRAKRRRQTWDKVADLFFNGPQALRLARGWKPLLARASVRVDAYVQGLQAHFPAPILLSRPLWNMDAAVNSLFASADSLTAFLQSPANGLRQFFEREPRDEVFFAITASVDKHVHFGSRMQGDIILRDEREETITFRDHALLEPHSSLADTMGALQLAGLRFIVAAAVHHVVQERVHQQTLGQTRAILATKHKALALQLKELHGLVGETKATKAKMAELEGLIAELDQDLEAVAHNLGNPQDMLREVEAMLDTPHTFLRISDVRVRLTKEGVLLPLGEEGQGWCVDYAQVDSEEGGQARALILCTALRHEVLGTQGP